jgi:hypothetical protein
MLLWLDTHVKRMFQMFDVFRLILQVAKVNLNIAYIAMAIHAYFKSMFQLFHPLLDVCCKCFICMLHMLQIAMFFFAHNCKWLCCKCMFQIFQYVPGICCNCFI